MNRAFPLLRPAKLLTMAGLSLTTAMLAVNMTSPCLAQDANVTAAAAGKTSWQPAGWGGGGYYWSTVFHPTRPNVLYMGGDVIGVYKSEDGGKNFRMVNDGLANYEVYSIAVDRKNPTHLYAATVGGLCKSTDEGGTWTLLPSTAPKELRITGERGKSIRAISVDGGVIYAASPTGKIYKSPDGGQTWNKVYETVLTGDAADTRGVQFGKVNGAFFGGAWAPIKPPANVAAADLGGISFSFKGDGTRPRSFTLTLSLQNGAKFLSRNLSEEVANTTRREITLTTKDFAVDPSDKKTAAMTPAPELDWSQVMRFDLAASGDLPNQATTVRVGKMGFVVRNAAQPAEPAIDFYSSKAIQTYGNIRMLGTAAGTIYSVAQSPHDANFVIAATQEEGLVASRDGGSNWKRLEGPNRTTSVSFSAADPALIFASFAGDGVYKSTDAGATWTKASPAMEGVSRITEVVTHPRDAKKVYAIGAKDWSGFFFHSQDGGATWNQVTSLKTDSDHNPTLDGNTNGNARLSTPTNLTINPNNPDQLYISANWRSCLSEDGGLTWKERNHGADISVVTDIRFLGKRTYVSAMDEGSFVSEDGGKKWKQLWPPAWTVDLSGHNWRIAANEINGNTRIISTVTPWDQAHTPRIVLSEDSGKSYKVYREGLPTQILRPNTMWGQGHPRALAVDPANPQIVYLGIDGDPSANNSGGGIFKSVDGGKSWKQLPNQPGSRRMFFGLAVDPTDSKRIYWGACGAGGGLYRSQDGGDTWEYVFKHDQWVFNLMVAPDGTVYAAGKNLWRSTDNGKTWKTVTKFSEDRTVLGLETDPANPNRMWLSTTTWSSSNQGAIYETTDGAKTWNVITGDIPYVKPSILRYNPETKELWAGGVGLFKTQK